MNNTITRCFKRFSEIYPTKGMRQMISDRKMDMSSFLVDSYFTAYESRAKYMMGSSDPESLPLKEIVSDLSAYVDEPLSYALGNGYLPLREKLSTLYESITPDQIAIMNGGEETIYVAMHALLKPGDEIVVQMPSYQSLSVIAKEIGCSIIEYRPDFEEKWAFDPELLKTKITPKTRLLILNYPHNPTGTCLTDSEMGSVAELCRKHDLYLIADEVYRFLRMNECCSDASFADLYENTVALGSFSKTFAAPGLRLGWVATKSSELLHRLLAYRHFTSTCSNLPCQWIASELLNKRDTILQRNNAIVRRNAALLGQFLTKHADLFAYVPPQGATMAYVKLLGGQGAMDFCMEILEHTGVLIVPSSVLDNSDEYLRIGLGRESFPKCIQLLNEYLSDRRK